MNYACDQCGIREATVFHPYLVDRNPGSYCNECYEREVSNELAFDHLEYLKEEREKNA